MSVTIFSTERRTRRTVFRATCFLLALVASAAAVFLVVRIATPPPMPKIDLGPVSGLPDEDMTSPATQMAGSE